MLEVLVAIDAKAGAFGLKAGWLGDSLLINTDLEQEGEVYMVYASGIDGEANFALTYEDAPTDITSFNLSISGLKGRYSCADIHTGLANANILLVSFLVDANNTLDHHLTELNDGSYC